jgi:hypothetical protein
MQTHIHAHIHARAHAHVHTHLVANRKAMAKAATAGATRRAGGESFGDGAANMNTNNNAADVLDARLRTGARHQLITGSSATHPPLVAVTAISTGVTAGKTLWYCRCHRM